MTERLDRIEVILKGTAQQQAKNTAEIETLLGAISTNEIAIRALTTNIARITDNVERVTATVEGNELLIDTVRAEARADRQETRQLWNDAVTQMKQDRAEAKAEREANAKRFDAQIVGNRQRFDAQQEVIQRLLVELVEMNRDNRRLRDRVDGLERAS